MLCLRRALSRGRQRGPLRCVARQHEHAGACRSLSYRRTDEPVSGGGGQADIRHCGLCCHRPADIGAALRHSTAPREAPVDAVLDGRGQGFAQADTLQQITLRGLPAVAKDSRKATYLMKRYLLHCKVWLYSP